MEERYIKDWERTFWRMFWGIVLPLNYYLGRRGRQRGRDALNGLTISCNTRITVNKIPFGPWLFLAGCVGIPAWFAHHILKPLNFKPLEQLFRINLDRLTD